MLAVRRGSGAGRRAWDVDVGRAKVEVLERGSGCAARTGATKKKRGRKEKGMGGRGSYIRFLEVGSGVVVIRLWWKLPPIQDISSEVTIVVMNRLAESD